MPRVLAGFATLVAIAVGLLGWMDYTESPDLRFNTFADAVNEGFTGRGRWLPDQVPPSAREIRLAYDVDSNQRWVRFAFSLADSARVVDGMRAATRNEVIGRQPHRRVPWWDSSVTRRQEYALLAPVMDDDYPVCMAIDWKRGEGFGWSCSPGAV